MEMKCVVNPYVVLFGLPLMLAAIILGSVGMAAYLTPKPYDTHVDFAPKVTVAPAEIHVAPTTVNVPTNTPKVIVNNVPQEAPSVRFSVAGIETKPTATQVIEKIVKEEVPVYVPTEDKATVTITDVYAAAEKYVSTHST